MKGRLLAFGCSYTAGEGLPDMTKNSPIDKSKYSWASVLAKKYDREIVNKAEGGFANKDIWRSIMHTEFYTDDIVVVEWTFHERFSVLKPKGDRFTIGAWSKDRVSKTFFSHLYSEYDAWLDFFCRIEHVKTYLDNKKIANYHLSIDHQMFVKPLWSTVKYLDFDMEKSRTNFVLAEDGFHPGIEAHEYFANEIFNCIERKQFRNLDVRKYPLSL